MGSLSDVFNTLNDKQNVLIGDGAKLGQQKRYSPQDFFAPTHLKHYEDEKNTLVQIVNGSTADKQRIVLLEDGHVLIYMKDQKLYQHQKKALKSFFLGTSDPYEFFQRTLKQAYRNQIDNLKYAFDGLVTFPYTRVWIREDSPEDIEKICKQFSNKENEMDIKQHALRDDNVDVEMTVGQWLDAVRDYRLSDSYTTAELIAKKFDRKERLYEYNSEHYKLGKMSKYLVGSTIVRDTGDKTFYENKTDLIEVNDDDDIVRIYTTEVKPFKKQFSTEEGNMEIKQFTNNPLEGKNDSEISKFVLDLDETTTYNPDELKAMADICFEKKLDDCGEYLCDLAETRKVYLSQHSEVPTPTVGVEEIKQEVTPTEEPKIVIEEPTSGVCPHCGQTPCCCNAPTLASERTAAFSNEETVPVADEQVAQFAVDGNAKAFKGGKSLADAEPDLTKSAIRAKFEEGGYTEEDWQNFIFGYMCVDKKAPNISSGESKIDEVRQNSFPKTKSSKVKYFSKQKKIVVAPQKKIWE